MNTPQPSRIGTLSLAVAALMLTNSAFAMKRADSAANATISTPASSESTDRLIVRYRQATEARNLDDNTLSTARNAGSRRGVQVSHLKPTAGGAHVLRMNRKLSVDEVRAMAREMKANDANIDYAEPDRILTIQLVPTDSGYANQWHYKASSAEPGGLNLPAAWDKSTGTGVVVAVIDTGYRPHADLVANIVPGYDFIADPATAGDGGGRDSDAQDPGDATAAGACGTGSPATTSSWHGTHVSGTIAAVTNNGSGVAGVAYGAKVMPVRALGKCGGYTSDIAAGIIWASGGTVSGIPNTTTPAKVINMSLGGSGSCDTTTQNAINSARSRGTVVVVAAGNSNANAANYSPASCAGVITVASVGRSGGRAYYSNFGAAVDVAAPGGDMSTGTTNGIYSTLNAGTNAPGADNYAYYQGTSMATPHVAGVVALMLAKNAALTPDDVEARLKSSARAFPATCSQCGNGIVDANAAVDAATGTVTPPPPVTTPTAISELESNNTIATAQTITPTFAQVNGSIANGSTDTDYFKVTLAAGKTLTATLSAASATSDLDLYGYNAAGTRVAISNKGAGVVDSITMSNTSAASVVVYVRVLRFSSAAGSYALTLKQ